MNYIKGLVIALVISIITMSPVYADIHTNVVTLNHAEYVNIDRTIVRGGKTYPLYYTSKEDLYAYVYGDVACEMNGIYYNEIIKLLEDRHDIKATVYLDLDVTIFEAADPMLAEEVYKSIKDNFAFTYCQLNGVTNHPDMGLTYVVPIEGEMGPQDLNQLYWWTKFDKMLTTF
jgi:hypothetical protein